MLPRMTIDNYDRVDFGLWREEMLAHLREEKRRNALLQAALDKAMAEVARLQATALAHKPAPLPSLPLPDPRNGGRPRLPCDSDRVARRRQRQREFARRKYMAQRMAS